MATVTKAAAAKNRSARKTTATKRGEGLPSPAGQHDGAGEPGMIRVRWEHRAFRADEKTFEDRFEMVPNTEEAIEGVLKRQYDSRFDSPPCRWFATAADPETFEFPPLLIEVRQRDGSSRIVEIEDPRAEWVRHFNAHLLNVAAGRSARPVS